LGAYFHGYGCVLQEQRTLKELAAVESRTQEEMSFEQGASLAEKFQRSSHGKKRAEG
jgi:hypothetical protein